MKVPTLILEENKSMATVATEQFRAQKTQIQPTEVNVNKVQINYVKHCMYHRELFFF